jgi:hypothetical protein
LEKREVDLIADDDDDKSDDDDNDCDEGELTLSCNHPEK